MGVSSKGRPKVKNCTALLSPMLIHDMQGNSMIRKEVTMLMQQVREVMAVNQEMADKSSWIWLPSEQMRLSIRNENHGKARSLKQCNDQRPDQTAFFWRLSSQISFETPKGNSMM